MACFNTANAREMAAKSAEARRKRKEAACSNSFSPVSVVSPTGKDPGVSVACVRARLEALDALMARAKSDREWDNLSRAFDRLFRVWCVLTGTPGPGNLRPTSRSQRQINGPARYAPVLAAHSPPHVIPEQQPPAYPQVKYEMRDVPGFPGHQVMVVTDSPALRAEAAKRQAQAAESASLSPSGAPERR